MTHFAGRHVLVTGASRGIGAAIALAFAEAGARVSLLGRSLDTLHASATVIREAQPGSEVAPFVADITQADAVAGAIALARENLGPIHCLINNAGQAVSAAFRDTDSEVWDRMLAVNLTGAYHCTRAVIPDMLAGGFGRIVNIASTAGLRAYLYTSAYVAAKHGLVGLTRALALEYAAKGITVNAICPGFTDTGIVDDAIAKIALKTGKSPDHARAALVATNPQKSLITPAEVAGMAVWLCGPDSARVTGQALVLAGGEVMV